MAIPVPLTYPGMPAHRYWEIEDGRVDFGAIQAGSTDVVRMLLTDFALVYGDDWFLVPLDVPVGVVHRITSMEVRDTFGITSTVTPTVGELSAATTAHRQWAMYRTTGVGGPDLGLDVLFVPPALAMTTSGPPIEEVAYFRDEMANVVWAVERTVPSALGTPVDRYRTSRAAPPVQQALDVTQLGDAELVYRLATPQPANWYPYLARRTPAGDDITLERLAGSRPEGAIARESTHGRGRGGQPRRPRRPACLAVRPLDGRPAGAVVRPPRDRRPRRGFQRSALGRGRAAGGALTDLTRPDLPAAFRIRAGTSARRRRACSPGAPRPGRRRRRSR